ncbi:uncharacterized protein V1516DRAFT_681387 [Lipomyces oligophaga]|uniref:uncharacterized protein n=1 Tax=Lipomyces oligophaga TaxID=45792 RepID=UPI0034CDF7C4
MGLLDSFALFPLQAKSDTYQRSLDQELEKEKEKENVKPTTITGIKPERLRSLEQQVRQFSQSHGRLGHRKATLNHLSEIDNRTLRTMLLENVVGAAQDCERQFDESSLDKSTKILNCSNTTISSQNSSEALNFDDDMIESYDNSIGARYRFDALFNNSEESLLSESSTRPSTPDGQILDLESGFSQLDIPQTPEEIRLRIPELLRTLSLQLSPSGKKIKDGWLLVNEFREIDARLRRLEAIGVAIEQMDNMRYLIPSKDVSDDELDISTDIELSTEESENGVQEDYFSDDSEELEPCEISLDIPNEGIEAQEDNRYANNKPRKNVSMQGESPACLESQAASRRKSQGHVRFSESVVVREYTEYIDETSGTSDDEFWSF